MSRSALESSRLEQQQAAFTLIELLAVVAIFALMAAMIVPNMGLLQARNLRGEAEQIADWLELARQRTVVTGKPHRFHIDLDGSAYRLEAPGSFAAAAEPELDPVPEYGTATEATSSLSLAPPQQEAAVFQPLAGMYGNRRLEPGIFFAAVELDQGKTVEGETAIEFANDGTTDGATIVLENEDGDAIFIEIAPLADAVRIFHAK